MCVYVCTHLYVKLQFIRFMEQQEPRERSLVTPSSQTPESYALNPRLETRNPKPETRNPTPQTPNPKPQTPNPKP